VLGCIANENNKLKTEMLYLVLKNENFFPSPYFENRRRREGKGRKGKEREGKGGKGKEREGKGKIPSLHPKPTHKDWSCEARTIWIQVWRKFLCCVLDLSTGIFHLSRL
jgi:hypothetical protein